MRNGNSRRSCQWQPSTLPGHSTAILEWPLPTPIRSAGYRRVGDDDRVGAVAELLRVRVAYVSKAMTRRRTPWETMVHWQRGHKPWKPAPFYSTIGELGVERRDTTIEELRANLDQCASVFPKKACNASDTDVGCSSGR